MESIRLQTAFAITVYAIAAPQLLLLLWLSDSLGKWLLSSWLGKQLVAGSELVEIERKLLACFSLSRSIYLFPH